MVLTGLLMGAREFALYGMANILCQLTLAGAWFFGPKPMNLPLLGWASFASNVVLMAVMAATIALNRPLRQKYGLMLQSA
ncbi:HERC2, partial [Symbiodinium sp. CCMP2456]